MRKIIVLLLIILLSYPVISSEITDDYIDIAKNYLNDENRIKANEYIDLILLLEPNNDKAKSFREITLPEKDNINKEKIVEIKEVPLKIFLDNSSAKSNNNGVDYFNQGKYKDALYFFKRAVISNKNSHITYYNMALCYKALGNKFLAEYNFKLSHFINPHFSQSYVGLANIKKGAQRLKYLKLAAEQHDKDANFYLGKYYQQNKNYILASKYYNEALIIEPNLAAAYLELGKCYYELEDYELSIINLKKYLTYAYEDDYAHYLLAESYMPLRYDSQALKELKTAVMLNRKHEYLFSLAKLCYNNQKYDISIQILNQLIEDQDISTYYNQLGLCYFEKENVKEALVYFNKALEIDKKTATIYYNISKCYNLMHDSDKAQKYIDEAKLIVPATPRQYEDLTIMYYNISDFKSALSTINDGIQKFDNNKKLYKTKMKICKLIGNSNEYEKTKADLLLKFGVR